MNGLTLHLMRHGAPQRPGLLLGHRDEPALPSETAKCVARAEGLAFDTVVSSDLSRTLDPALRAATERGMEHQVDTDWRELDFGTWTGLAAAEVDPAAYARFWDDPDAHAPPGGETWSAFKDRVARALERIDGDTLVVTHAGAMRAALAVLFHMEHRQVWAFDLPYASVLTLRIWPGEAAQITGLSG